MNSILLLDCHYLAYRAFYSVGALSYNDVKTGVIFGFLKEVTSLIEDFAPTYTVFCFDSVTSKRKELFPDYKRKRHQKELTVAELAARSEFRRQLEYLRTRYLPTMGFRNVLYAEGYEADDLIASVVLRENEDEDNSLDITVISADEDMYQLIRPYVTIHSLSNKKPVTYQSFSQQYGLHPVVWARMIAMSGCHTDEVPGIPGIGKKTAIRYLQGALPESSKKFRDIESRAGVETIKRNRALVQLPFKDTPQFTLKADRFSEAGWRDVIDELGMKSLRLRPPLLVRGS